MFEKLKKLFNPTVNDCPPEPKRLAQLAATALLIELCHADHEADISETRTVLAIARDTFALTNEELDEFFSEAETQQQSATSLYEFTDVVNRHFDKAGKFELVCDLWKVAYADGTIDRYEDHTIRKIAELIYVSHTDFIRAKHLMKD